MQQTKIQCRHQDTITRKDAPDECSPYPTPHEPDTKTMQETAHLRRLTAFNYLLLCIVVLGAMLYVANSKLTNFRRDFEKVHVRWEVDGSITFSSSSDGPFIISHLFMFPSGPNEPDSIAHLPRPIVIVESGAVSLTKAEVDS
jgi:hypothetical protein